MTKNAQILFDLLKQEGFIMTDVHYEFNNPISHYSAWYATDQQGNEYRLGKNLADAKSNIENGILEKMED